MKSHRAKQSAPQTSDSLAVFMHSSVHTTYDAREDGGISRVYAASTTPSFIAMHSTSVDGAVTQLCALIETRSCTGAPGIVR